MKIMPSIIACVLLTTSCVTEEWHGLENGTLEGYDECFEYMTYNSKLTWVEAVDFMQSGDVVGGFLPHSRFIVLWDANDRGYLTAPPNVDQFYAVLKNLEEKGISFPVSGE